MCHIGQTFMLLGTLQHGSCVIQPTLGTYIMSQIARIEELSLDFTSLVVVSQLLSTNSGASADKLRVLRLRRRGIEHIANPLPRGIFARDMRNLRHLQLEAFPLSEALPCFPHLTKLDIDGKKSFMPTPLAVLLASLEKSPSITSLTLDQVEQSGPQSAVNGDLLTLPNLSELRVYTVYAHNRPAIFQYLTVPPDCTVRISWQGQVPTPFSSAFMAMEPVFRNALQNSSREIHSFGLVENEGHLRLSLHSGLEEPMFDTAMNASSIADTSVRRIISLLASPRMSSARMIALVLSNSHILPSMGISDWSPLIARLDNLRELDLSFVGGLFFDLMSKEISGGSIPLPLLETLVFKELDWVSAPPLIEALQARSAAGLRLNELRLFDSVISPSMVEVLKELTNLSLS
ncbi:hypothetical protein ONZ45_g3775 [Pleurotus djamor]|nr:hypothetical protein ONZ45_g3775 [Pleurotus djamor]